MTTTVIGKIQLREDTAANWTNANPVLMVGECGYESDTHKLKIGRGTAWNDLAYYYDPAGAAASLTAHEAAADPHPGYLTPAEGNAAYEAIGAVAGHAAGSGVHSIASTTGLQAALDSKSATVHDHDTAYEPKNANLQSHVSSTSNPHSTTAAQVGADSSGTAAGLIASHEAASNPHPGYLTSAEGDAAYAPIANGVTGGDSHNHAGVYLPVGADAADLTSGEATDNYVLTADGAGGAAWEAAAVTYAGAASETHAAASKTPPVDADELPIANSESGWALGKITFGNLKTWLKSLFAVLAGKSGGQTIIGGTGVTDKLVLQGTSGNGTSSENAIELNVGNNGATTALTVLNDGTVTIETLDATSILTQSELISANLFGAL